MIKRIDSFGEPTKATIRDVARAAGLSITTASHVINNRPGMPEKTRQAIFQAVEKVGYRPNPTARSLRTGVTNIISLTFRPNNAVHGSLSGTEYHLRLAGAAAAAALDRGLGLVQLPEKMLLEGGLPTDGCIVVAPFGNDTLLEELIGRGMPVVTADPDPDRTGFRHWAGRDEAPGVRSLLDHLFENGARRIVLVTGQDDNSWTRNSRLAYSQWAGEHGLPARLLDVPENNGFARGVAVMATLLGAGDRPDAVVAASSPIAAGVASGALQHGLSIPADIRVATLSDAEATRSFSPPITALDLQPETIGRTCVDMLCKVIAGQQIVPFVTSGQLKKRLSTS